MRTLKSFAYTLAALGAITVAGCSGSAAVVVDPPPDSTLRVSNQSDFAITEIHVTPVGNPSWGPNLISGDVLLPGEALTVPVQCDTYDALLVDEDNVDCQLHSVDLCFSNAAWVIRNNTCAVFGAAREAAAKAAAQDAINGSAAASDATVE